jgi:hypothetical protein
MVTAKRARNATCDRKRRQRLVRTEGPVPGEKISVPAAPRPGSPDRPPFRAILTPTGACEMAPRERRPHRPRPRQEADREARCDEDRPARAAAFLPEGWIRESGPVLRLEESGRRSAPTGAAETHELVAIAEKIVRTLRVGSDASGQPLVILELGAGRFAGARIELRRESGGVRIRMRTGRGTDDAHLEELERALRARGIPIV